MTALESAIVRHNYADAGPWGYGWETADLPDLGEFLRAAPNLRRLSVSPGDLTRMISTGGIADLRGLTIVREAAGIDMPVFDEPFPDGPALGACPAVGGLEELTLADWWPLLDGNNHTLDSLTTLRRLTLLGLAEDGIDSLRGAPFLDRLERLDFVSAYVGWADSACQSLTEIYLPRLRRLTLRGNGPFPDLTPIIRSRSMPNLCTFVIDGMWVRPDTRRDVKRLVEALATEASGMPQLSLVGAGDSWWVLDNGVARPVLGGIAPLECDWWEAETPDDDVFRG